jgi:hypothetical protein
MSMRLTPLYRRGAAIRKKFTEEIYQDFSLGRLSYSGAVKRLQDDADWSLKLAKEIVFEWAEDDLRYLGKNPRG